MSSAERTIVEGSFHVKQDLELAAPRDRVFDALLQPQSWWCHTFAKGPTLITLDPRPGGFFMEHWSGGGAVWGRVVFLRRPELIRLSGPLGMDTPVNSVYQFALDEAGPGRTRLRLDHRCVGLIDPRWHESHERGWKELWTHLRAFVENGRAVDRDTPR